MVSDGTILRRLWVVVRNLAKELDCQEGQATAYILAGKLPVVSAISAIATPMLSKNKPNNGKIEITIRQPVSEDELIKVYRKLRLALWGDKRDRQSPSERDCKLVEYVKQRLDETNPQWEKLMNEWNNLYPEWAYFHDSGYRGFRKAYMDAYKKIYPDINWGEITFTN